MDYGDAIEKTAREIAGCDARPLRLELARAVAQANIDLAKVRQIKTLLIDRVVQFSGEAYVLSSAEPIIFTTPELRRAWRAIESGKPLRLRSAKPLANMPEGEPDLTAEAIEGLFHALLRSTPRHEKNRFKNVPGSR
jgi:hypothetical protein